MSDASSASFLEMVDKCLELKHDLAALRERAERAERDLREAGPLIDQANQRDEALEKAERERDEARVKARDICQMIRDRVAQREADEYGYVPHDKTLADISLVADATGNRCDDDSLWFAGTEWNEIVSSGETAKAQLAALRSAVGEIEQLAWREYANHLGEYGAIHFKEIAHSLAQLKTPTPPEGKVGEPHMNLTMQVKPAPAKPRRMRGPAGFIYGPHAGEHDERPSCEGECPACVPVEGGGK
jgi:hypothetical protein